MAFHEGYPGAHGGIRRREQGPVAARIQVRGLDDLLRHDAGHGHGERPSGGLFPLQTSCEMKPKKIKTLLKYTPLNDRLFKYLCAARSVENEGALESLRSVTEAMGDIAEMQIGRDQGTFMTLLVAAIGAREAIEVGTFTGFSSICIARGLPKDGRLLCLDVSKEWTTIARKYWARAGVDKK